MIGVALVALKKFEILKKKKKLHAPPKYFL